MDKIEREDAAKPVKAGSAANFSQSSIDDDVTAEVVPESEHAGRNEPVIISNLTEADLSGNRADTDDDDALEPGFILRDRFEIVELVHSGGMGRVYKALDNRRNRSASDQVHVAIKMMRRSLDSGFDGRLALEREAARTQQLSHPGIVNIYDFDQHDEQFFIVMEWLDGESLNALLRRTSGKPIAADFAWRIVQGIASGLRHAHSHDVVHADINPSNVFITDTQEIKLLDFGVARQSGQPDDETDGDIVWATHSYASPEVLAGSTPGFEDDIYSLGCVAYRALSGRHPFNGKSSTVAKREQLDLEPIPGLADRYWQVLKQSLALDKADRPSSAAVFFVDLPGANEQVVAPHRSKVYWLPVLLLAVTVPLAGYWWWQQNQAGEPQPVTAEPVVIDEMVAIEAEPIPEPSNLDLLLTSASQAMDTMRLVEPEDDNARAMFREALALDPSNATALAGLREISSAFVREAEFALRANDPEGATEALDIASETDPENPELDIVGQVLLARANSALANAQLAAIEGDAARAGEMLAQAERYTLIDAGAIDAVRDRIDQGQQEQALIQAVAAADASIAAGNLVAPVTGNAHTQLLELQSVYGDEPRVVASIERLVERLLNRAAFATAAEQFPVAAELLEAAAEFGVLESDVATARTWLQQAEDLESVSMTPATAMSGTIESTEGPTDGITDNTSGAGATALSADEDILNSVPADPAATGPTQSRPERLVQLSDLEIENFVSPRYPPRASEAGRSGLVDLHFDVNQDGSTGNVEIVNAEPADTFVPAAINAVLQWRFAERDDIVRAQVRLRFDPQAPQ